MKQWFGRYIGELFCRHNYQAFEKVPGGSKEEMIESWSSESGVKTYDRFKCKCTKCGKKQTLWFLTKSVCYGGVGVQNYDPIKTKEAEKCR